jgi:hypothetical protein
MIPVHYTFFFSAQASCFLLYYLFAGEKGIVFDQLDRPTSAFSSRPSSSSTTASSTESKHNREVFMQARVRLHDSESDGGKEETPAPVAPADDQEVKSDGNDQEVKSDGNDQEVKSDGNDQEVKSDGNGQEVKSGDDKEDGSSTPFRIASDPPDSETKLADIVDDLPDHVLSRSGTPSQWAFDDKETSLKTAPPRPTTATLCSPPVPRKVPISVDHHLRK